MGNYCMVTHILYYFLSYTSLCFANRKLNIALHAQLFPSADKVVGSVITTSGLREAFKVRDDVDRAEIFYPSHYMQYLNYSWDLVLIEGWFPSIDSFLLLTRNNFPRACIFFICLDPTYPGKQQVSGFDVDGILTNSAELFNFFGQRIPADYMMLAADPATMRPFANISREWGSIYVGAGGHMLQVKPELRGLLTAALPYGLRLHGSSWDTVPEFSRVAMGTLPQEQLAQAYASAHVVLASTIQSQSQYGMVNNRIFEALSCGALVVSLWAAELAALQCPALLLIEENISLPDYMDAIINGNQAVVAELREAGRNWVLKQHTWGHRVVQILDFYHYQQRGEFAPPLTKVEVSTATASVCGTVWCERANCPKMLWLVSPHLQFHSDYTFAVRSIGRLHLCALFEIYVQIYNEEDSFFDTSAAVDLSAYEIMVAIVTPFDALDLAMRRLDVVHLPAAQVDLGGPRVQKRGCYVIGYDPALVLAYLNAQPVGEVGVHPLAFHHYDAIWYRSSFEIAKFAEIGVSFGEPSRMQQMFGIGVFPPAASASASMEDDPTQATKAHTPLADDAGTTKMTQGARVVVVCFYRHAQLCTRQIRESFVRKVHPHGRGEELSPYTLLGLGGQWRDWLQLADKTDGGLPFLSLKELPSVVHVRDGWSGDAVRIVQSAEFVVIMNPAGPDDQLDCTAPLPAATSPHVQNMNVVKQVLECQLSRMNERSNSGGAQATTEEVMWPLVAAAVSYTRIHLLHRSALLLDLVVAGDCSSWSEEFLAVNMVKVGMNRLLGLGSRLSTVQPRLLGAHDVDAKVRCESSPSDHGDEDEDNALFHSFVASHELSAQYDISAVRFALVELHFDEFVSGRDGEACIQQPDVLLSGPEDVENPSHDGNATVVVDGNRPGDIVCLMRPYRYVAVVLSTGPTTAPTDSWNYYSKYAMSSTICRAAVELSIQLRGNFFGDSFYSATVSIPTADLGRFSLVPRKWNNIWLDKHSIFVYNAHYC